MIVRIAYISKDVQFLDDYWLYSDQGISAELHTFQYTHKHCHSFYEIAVVLKGSMRHYFTFQSPKEELTFEEEVLSAGNVQIIPPSLVHYYEFVEPATEYINITVSKPIFEKIKNLLSLNLFEFLPIKAHITPEYLKDVFSQFQNIFSNDYDELEKADLYKMLVMDILRAFVEKSKHESLALPQWLIDLLIILQNPHYFNMSVDEIAKTTNYSHSRLCKLFKDYMKISVQKYLFNQKMEYSCHLLRNSDLKIITIATHIGYDSHSFYSKMFFARYGISPTDYRKKYKIQKIKL